MTVHHHQATWADREPRNVDGKTATSCQICDTQNVDSDGRRAVFRAFIISSSEFL